MITLRELLVEAIRRAEHAGRTHDHSNVLVVIDQQNPRKRTGWTLAEARRHIAMIDNQAAMN